MELTFCYSWSIIELSESLITLVTDDRVIKQALFPSPGSNTSSSKGGVKPKMEYHWILAKLLFTDHEKYGKAFQRMEECKEVRQAANLRRIWGSKIKNQLVKYVVLLLKAVSLTNSMKRMVKITNTHKATLGQTVMICV